jgi:LmbE family N-acetylglucosaminyl deacetylase
MMKLRSPHASIFVPDGVDLEKALARCTHLAIGTHPDDIELIGMHGIETCYESDTRFFAGVVVTDGAGSPRTGEYADVTDAEMVVIRKDEQNAAAKLGRYGVQIQLAYPSSTVKSLDQTVADDLSVIFKSIAPNTIYLHNPFDRHTSHRAVLECCMRGLRSSELKPAACYGVEVWRSLDFLPADLRIALSRDQYPDLANQLISAFKSQVAGGKRYDLAFAGRGLANATFAESHHVDNAKSLSFALDLLPLIKHPELDMADFKKQLFDQITIDCLKNSC